MAERVDTRRILALRTLPIFRDVPAPVVAGAAKLMHEKKFERGELVQEKDTVVPRILILPAGKVAIDRDGKTMEIKGPAYLGLYYALSGVAADARVTALTELKMFVLDAADLFDLFEDHFPILRSSI
ncbi:MAG TPA: cyclic nucleotide-binding domain-containing protein, partial [Polyangiaceae bacterium]